MSQKLKELMADTFYNVQFNKICHKKYIQKLAKIYEQHDLDIFFKEFISCLKISLSFSQQDLAIENTLQFAAKFALRFYSSADTDTSEPMCPFLEKLFDFVLKHHNAKEPAVRFRICHFLNILLNSMGEQAYIDDALCDTITQNMTERLLDKSHKVRAQAVFALHRLQDPSDINCPIIKMYIYHLCNDSKVEVRKAVLSSMAKNQYTLHAALERIRDTNDVVRKMAYDFISKITVKSLTIKQRNQVLNEGLKDRADIVRQYVEKVLLPTWLRYFNGEYIDLLKALDAEIGTEVSILVLKIFLKNTELEKLISQVPIDRTRKLIPIDKLTSENSLYWRTIVQHLHSISYTEALETILPELSTFSEYINEFLTMMSSKQYQIWEKQNKQFILLQLFEIIKTYDLSDEVGRIHLGELILKVLLTDHCSKEIIECVIKHLENVMPDVNKRLNTLVDVINKIRMPTNNKPQTTKTISPETEHENNMQRAKIRVKLLELKEEEYNAIQSKEYLKAEEIKKQINVLNEELIKLSEQPEPDLMIEDDIEIEKSDSETMIKCLTIICAMMKDKAVTTLTPTLKCLMNIMFSSLDHPDDRVHILALEALGICCILDKELAKTHIWTFLLQFSLEQENHQIWIITLKVVFDLLLLYGLEYLDVMRNINNSSLNKSERTERTVKLYNRTEEQDLPMFNQTNKEIQNADITKILMELMDNADPDLRNIATEGLCKLLLNRRISGCNLLVRMIITYYNPAHRDDTNLCQCLTSFFNQFIQKVPSNQEMLEETFFPVLHTLFKAPETSPLQEIDPYDVVSFILNLTRYRNGFKMSTYSVHNNLAFAILADILNPSSKIDKDILIKSLKNLDVQIDDDVAQQSLRDGIEKVSLLVNKVDKRLIRYVEIFKKNLEKIPTTTIEATETTIEATATTIEATATTVQETETSKTNTEE